FNDKLINTMASLPKVCRNVHLPLQSGSDRILKRMNRQYTGAQYLEIAEKIRHAMPGVSFSTDVIVGFPGETEEDFNATRTIMNKVGFDNAYIFKYSPRQGTPAADMEDQVLQEQKEERNQILLADLAERVEIANAKYKGHIVEVLVEGPSKRNESRWSGRTSTYKTVIFAPLPHIAPGDIVQVQIKRTTSMSLFGDIVEKQK
ncbi:MAG: TRAM domain-containing protein, partial [Victivallales bacterium]|nr:TRAM domain-containing protein [Victivallales bacterium]